MHSLEQKFLMASTSGLPVAGSFGLLAVATLPVEPAAVDDLPSSLPKADPIQAAGLDSDDLFLSKFIVNPNVTTLALKAKCRCT